MPGNFRKSDLRVKRTHRDLFDALLNLLKDRSFIRITVNDLCDEALISRTAFYSHFQDKYDLLEKLLLSYSKNFRKTIYDFKLFKECINQFVDDNSKVIKHLLKDANIETQELFNEFIISLFKLPKMGGGNGIEQETVMANFCAGGLMNLLMWQIKNDYPPNIKLINDTVLSVLELLGISGNVLTDAENDE